MPWVVIFQACPTRIDLVSSVMAEACISICSDWFSACWVNFMWLFIMPGVNMSFVAVMVTSFPDVAEGFNSLFPENVILTYPFWPSFPSVIWEGLRWISLHTPAVPPLAPPWYEVPFFPSIL